jgi:hypothetical protein
MAFFDWHGESARDGHKVNVSGQPVAMHCRHYNIILHRTVKEALGNEGIRRLFSSVEEASYISFQQLQDRHQQIKTLKSRLEMAAILFQNCGLGEHSVFAKALIEVLEPNQKILEASQLKY